MAVEPNTTTSQALAQDQIPVYIKDKLLSLSERQLVFYQFGDKELLPEGSGKTLQFTRYERLPLPIQPLNEGETPDRVTLQTSVVQTVLDQWGAVVSLTDVAQLTIKHPVMKIATERLADQHSETIDREIQKVLMGGSNVNFPNAKTSRSSLTGTDVLSADMLRKLVSVLRAAGAKEQDGKLFAAVIDPYVEQDLTAESTFVLAMSYGNHTALYNNEIGMWMGFRFVRSNFLPIIANLASGTDNGTNRGNITLNTGAVSGINKFPTGSGNVVGQLTLLDPQTGFETLISQVITVTDGGSSYFAQVDIWSSAPSGTYGVYLSLQNSTIPTLQFYVAHTNGTGQTYQVGVSGTGNGTTSFVDSATGVVAPPAPPATGNVHVGYIFAKEAFGVATLGSLVTTLTPPIASDSDPLIQRRKMGWKQMWKGVIKNPNFYMRFETRSAYN